jgi:hypothetical protein
MTSKVHHNGGVYETLAAGRFMEAIDAAWDSLDPYEATAKAGELAEPDADALRAICGETGDDYDAAEAEVLSLIRNQVAIGGK